jgi:lipid-A-disaccharide synthase
VLAECVDQVAVVLPFEVAGLEQAGVRASFVGHPLLDLEAETIDRDAFASRCGLDPTRPLLALLPGSRRQEVVRHIPLFVDAARRVARPLPEVQAVIGRARALPTELYEGVDVPVVDDVPALLAHADAALLKSGTVTLEAALARVPSVVAYRTSALTWSVARRVVRVDHVALPNLIVARRVVPELLQDAATPEALAAALIPLLDRASPERARQLEAFDRVRDALGGPGATSRVAALALSLLDARA